ncbi:MAG: TadE/TadG family type IV pilus assembly protein [Hyphomonas sp.]
MFRRYKRHTSGNIVTPLALMGCVLVAVGGGAIDFMNVINQKSYLKTLSDNAALSAVREMTITANDPERIAAVATAYVAQSEHGQEIDVTPVVDTKAYTITVTLTTKAKTYFLGPMSETETVSASSTAKLSGTGGNVCMIGLSPSAVSTLRMRERAKITAADCAIYSNSTSSSSMMVSPTADVSAAFVCVAGGYKGAKTIGLTSIVEDCPKISDPLASRPQPKVGACDYQGVYITGRETLSPGVYCGGLIVDRGTVKLQPGVYIIMGGPLTVTNGGTLEGDDVGFYLADEAAKIGFDYDATIDIAAPRVGIMAGLLIWSAPYADVASMRPLLLQMQANTATSTASRVADGAMPADHVIRSDNARRLVGTIYLPNGKLLIDGSHPIADRSEYTVIIADTFELRSGPNLVLKTDYALSDVPVPEGVGPTKDVSSVLVR